MADDQVIEEHLLDTTTEETREHFRRRQLGEVPDLAVGDKVVIPGTRPQDTFTVVELLAGGMLVQVIDQFAQLWCFPRYLTPGGWVTRA